jgi:hypothetical protein
LPRVKVIALASKLAAVHPTTPSRRAFLSSRIFGDALNKIARIVSTTLSATCDCFRRTVSGGRRIFAH